MRNPKSSVFAALVVLAVIGVAGLALAAPGPGGILASLQGGSASGQSSSGSGQSSWSSSQSSSSMSQSTACSSAALGPANETRDGTITSGSGSTVNVTSAQALIYNESGGQSYLVFEVSYQNLGSTTLYFASGCASPVKSSIVSGSDVVKTIDTGAGMCECAAAYTGLAPGESRTSVDPGCWSAYRFQVIGTGYVTVSFTVTWAFGSYGGSSGSTTTTAQFYV